MAVINTIATTETAGPSQLSDLRAVRQGMVIKINIDGALRTAEDHHAWAPARAPAPALNNSIGVDKMVPISTGRETINDPTKLSLQDPEPPESQLATRQTQRAQTIAPLSASSQGANQNL
jgi:hypothetical protein